MFLEKCGLEFVDSKCTVLFFHAFVCMNVPYLENSCINSLRELGGCCSLRSFGVLGAPQNHPWLCATMKNPSMGFRIWCDHGPLTTLSYHLAQALLRVLKILVRDLTFLLLMHSYIQKMFYSILFEQRSFAVNVKWNTLLGS